LPRGGIGSKESRVGSHRHVRLHRNVDDPARNAPDG
jgi:hypothetical protein